MRAGDLRSRITIQKRGPTKDDWGTPMPDAWADLDTVWADVRHPSGLEMVKADATTSVVKASIRIRWRSDVTAGMRVLFDGRVYNILAVLPDARRVYVDLPCEGRDGI